MRLNVKILGGSEVDIEASPLDTVDDLKAEVEAKLRLAKADQKLLFRGKALQGLLSNSVKFLRVGHCSLLCPAWMAGLITVTIVP